MNRITSLLGIQYPIVQGGMVWCSGWRLASAVSNAGGLGLIGAGSMHPEILREHIRKCRVATEFPFGVNIPLMYPQIEEIMNIVVEEGVKIIFTSAGNPKTWTGWLKERGITVVHIVSSSRFAVKCEEAGVDAVVAEGFEAGGHNGREETTTFCLIPAVREATTLPLIAASVRTFVVSWKDAADRKEFVARDALVIPSITCLPSAGCLPSASSFSLTSSTSRTSTSVPGRNSVSPLSSIRIFFSI